jgi:hypothetical protein
LLLLQYRFNAAKMKTIFLSLLIFMSSIVYSQPEPATGKLPKEKKRKFTKFFIQLNYNMPLGSFSDDFKTNPNLNVEADLRNNISGNSGGMNADKNYGAEAGCFFYFKKSESKKIRSGIKASFISFASFPYRWQNDTGDYIFNDAKYKNVKLFGLKAGPFLETGKNNFTFIFAYQIAPTFASKGSWSYEDAYTEVDGNVRYFYTDRAMFNLDKGFGLKHELMMGLRYNQFFGGASFSFGNLTFNNIEFERRLYAQIETYNASSQTWSYYGSDSDLQNISFKSKMPLAFLSIQLGWVF